MSINAVLGPMFGAKTTEVMKRIGTYNIAGISTIMLKFSGDTRYSNEDEIITHSHQKYTNNDGLVMSTNDLATVDIIIQKNDIKAIGVDEFQFYKNPQFVLKWANEGRHVYLAALDGDFRSEIFPNIAYILPLCDRIKKFHAVCTQCKKMNAISTRRTTDDTEQVIIGGSELYIPLCRKCSSWGLNKTNPKL